MININSYFNDLNAYLSDVRKSFQKTPEETLVGDILFNDTPIAFGDQKLNSIAALTYNSQQCDRILKCVKSTIFLLSYTYIQNDVLYIFLFQHDRSLPEPTKLSVVHNK